ncbi:hypothetical protein [Fredinandcohnia quinoae]|uniref:YtzI protein n=1 Tax=Fredinandcohnia quinoae TaxID=2918902 RepID=A0AAW5E3T6_9BACI|nr:hypothetical protein [Fredinandcohnia sp. SECRCQ15]MCH1624011.1 hypothetical protein [Fredinandcohnia sp. SECRCQ15]
MGLLIGILLFCLTIVVAVSIGMKANQNVRAYKDDEHEIFVGNEKDNL